MKIFSNSDVSALLRKVAAAYTVKEMDRFRIIAYENAAEGIEKYTGDVYELWKSGKIDEIEGVGKGISSYIDELFKTGRVKHFEEEFSSLPAAMFIFMDIPGIGAKTAYKLCLGLKISDEKKAIEKLREAAISGKIRNMSGFGTKSEKDILQGIDTFLSRPLKEKRMLLPYASIIAQEIIDYLIKNPKVIRADALGSLRRKVATIGDIDIAVATNNPEEVIAWFIKYPKIKKIVDKGEKLLVRVILENNQHIDLRLQPSETYGSILQYFTGSKNHNISLREMALKKGMSLSEYGIKISGKLHEFRKEEGFYKFLGMDWIPPELREDTGEIQSAINHKLPELLETEEIKGDLHIHSDFRIETSHDVGANSMQQVIDKAVSLGYEYLGFSEHNPSSSRHTNKEIIALIRRKQEVIDAFNTSIENRTNKLPITILNGIEADIQPNGELAVPDEAFEYLDYVIASVHSEFNLPKEAMTGRVIKALSHSKVKIFGHPTGRLLEKRDGYELDWDLVLEFCFNNNKWLEINAWPERLDLPETLIRQAVNKKVKMIINTDSHEVSQMDFMANGVFNARRGWAEKSDIINTRGLKEFLKELKNNEGR